MIGTKYAMMDETLTRYGTNMALATGLSFNEVIRRLCYQTILDGNFNKEMKDEASAYLSISRQKRIDDIVKYRCRGWTQNYRMIGWLKTNFHTMHTHMAIQDYCDMAISVGQELKDKDMIHCWKHIKTEFKKKRWKEVIETYKGKKGMDAIFAEHKKKEMIGKRLMEIAGEHYGSRNNRPGGDAREKDGAIPLPPARDRDIDQNDLSDI